jgi:hypothetical protein
MNTYTRTGNEEEYNDTSFLKKKKEEEEEKKKKRERKTFSQHTERQKPMRLVIVFFCVRKHLYSFRSLF